MSYEEKRKLSFLYMTPFPAMELGISSMTLPQRRGKGYSTMKQHTLKESPVKTHGLPNLRLLRQRKGLSLGQLADMTGLRRDTIAHLEDGREDPQPYHIRLLARVLNVPQFDLVS